MSTDLNIQDKRKRGKGNGEVSFVTKLGAAKLALAQAQEMPEFTDLIDHAEAVRAAGKALHISAEGINAWTRFVVDAERAAHARIEKMRADGELLPRGRPKAKNANLAALSDIIDRRPLERASEWRALSQLTEHQLNEAERIANEEDRILSRHELIMLAKAGTPKASKGEKTRSTEELGFISRAQDQAFTDGYQGDEIEIRDDAKIDRTEKGAWVEAWVWVTDPLAEGDLEDDEPSS